MIFWLLYSFSQAPEQVDRRQLKHKGELNPALHEYRVNHLAQELQLASQPQPPSTLNSPSTPALDPSQFLELLANAMSSSSANNKGSSKISKDLTSDTTKQFSAHTAYEHATHTGGSGGVTTAVYIKQEGGVAGQSSKAVQGQGSKSTAATTPQSSPGYQGGSGGSLAKLKTMERPKTDHSGTKNSNSNSGGGGNGVPDTPLTHFRTGSKPAFVTGSSSTSSSCGQRTTCNSGGGSSGGSNRHPLLASSTMPSATKSEGQSSGQQASAQTGTGNSHTHVRTKGPVTRSTVRASSPSTYGDALPVVSGSPPLSSEKNAKSAEKPHGGLSSEEARKLRQAQQKLQKEQWMKKYGQGTKRTLELQSGAAGSSSGDGGRQMPQSNSDTGAEAMENGVLISDGELNLVKGRHEQ